MAEPANGHRGVRPRARAQGGPRNRRLERALALVAVLAPPCVASAGDVQVQDHGGGHYTLGVELEGTTDPAHGQIVVAPVANGLCGARHPHFGRYRFEAREPSLASAGTGTSSMRFSQQVQCRDTPQERVEARSAPVPPAPAEPPTAHDHALVRARTLGYLQAKAAADAAGVYAMLSAEVAGDASPESWAEGRKAFHDQAGAGAQPGVVRLTWYDDPPGAPMPGRYVAADYRVDYPSRAFTCGYVVWRLQADDRYLVVRDEEARATPDVVRGLDAGALATMRSQLQCRD